MENERAGAGQDSRPNSGDQTLRRELGQGKFCFLCSADHEQDWQPYPVDAQSAESDDHEYESNRICSLLMDGEWKASKMLHFNCDLHSVAFR